MVLIFKTNHFSGTIRPSDEGEVYWMSKEKLPECKLANDMDEMFEIFESDALTEFYYYYNEDGSWGHTVL